MSLLVAAGITGVTYKDVSFLFWCESVLAFQAGKLISSIVQKVGSRHSSFDQFILKPTARQWWLWSNC